MVKYASFLNGEGLKLKMSRSQKIKMVFRVWMDGWMHCTVWVTDGRGTHGVVGGWAARHRLSMCIPFRCRAEALMNFVRATLIGARDFSSLMNHALTKGMEIFDNLY